MCIVRGSDLLATVDAISPELRTAPRRHPDSSQRVAVHLVLYDQPLPLLMLRMGKETLKNCTYDFYETYQIHEIRNGGRTLTSTPTRKILSLHPPKSKKKPFLTMSS